MYAGLDLVRNLGQAVLQGGDPHVTLLEGYGATRAPTDRTWVHDSIKNVSWSKASTLS